VDTKSRNGDTKSKNGDIESRNNNIVSFPNKQHNNTSDIDLDPNLQSKSSGLASATNDLDNNDLNNNKDVIDFNQANTESTSNDATHEVLLQDPYYKFIHDLLHAIESVGMPLDKNAKDKARELYAKYQRENLIAKWQQEFEEERLEKEKNKDRPKLIMVEKKEESDAKETDKNQT